MFNSFLTRSCAFCFLIAILSFSCNQNKKASRPSPLTKDSTALEGARLKIVYSSPAVRKREIWGELVPYDQIWRTGANEATWFETSTDLLVNHDTVPRGRYAIFTIPQEDKWIVIFNKEWDQWGAYSYKDENDVARLEVYPQRTSGLNERMTFSFEDDELVFRWEYLTFSLSLTPLNSSG